MQLISKYRHKLNLYKNQKIANFVGLYYKKNLIHICFHHLSDIQPPDSVHIQEVGERSVYISWFPPESDFNCIDGFEVVWTNTEYPEETGSKKVSASTYNLAIGTEIFDLIVFRAVVLSSWVATLFWVANTCGLVL